MAVGLVIQKLQRFVLDNPQKLIFWHMQCLFANINVRV